MRDIHVRPVTTSLHLIRNPLAREPSAAYGARLPSTCDHILWGAPTLEMGVQSLFDRTGVQAAFGGHHPDLGTHNALAALGRSRYVEVLAPDPELPPGALVQRLRELDEPAVIMWAARIDDAAALAARAEAEGYDATVVEGHRPQPDGRTLRWTNVFVAGHGAGVLVPFFIAWHDGVHPAREAPTGLRLHAMHVESPQPEALRAVYEALDVRMTVRRGAKARIVTTVDSPRGRVELAGPPQS